jgi:hypothetical protein
MARRLQRRDLHGHHLGNSGTAAPNGNAPEQNVDATIAAAQRGALGIKDCLDVKYTNMVLM